MNDTIWTAVGVAVLTLFSGTVLEAVKSALKRHGDSVARRNQVEDDAKKAESEYKKQIERENAELRAENAELRTLLKVQEQINEGHKEWKRRRGEKAGD